MQFEKGEFTTLSIPEPGIDFIEQINIDLHKCVGVKLRLSYFMLSVYMLAYSHHSNFVQNLHVLWLPFHYSRISKYNFQ